MRNYFCFFRTRFHVGLQYRLSAFMQLLTQFLWGLMECVAFYVLKQSNPETFPMEFSAVVSYYWLKEAFFTMFNLWMTDSDIFDMIVDGGISYELCRPVSVYDMWFWRNMGGRAAAVSLRCIPILLMASFLPQPYRMTPPESFTAFVLFLATMILGLFVAVSFCMLVFMLCFFTISPLGVRMVLTGAVELLSGAIIPLPFVPQPIRGILELLPFAAMQNVPLRIYSGDLAGAEMVQAVGLQVFWLAVLLLLGKVLCRMAQRRIVIQGG